MENKIKVSIIVPIYNVEKYIHQALDSILNQTLKDIEIICIDDCSTDNSLAILKEYESKDSRLKVFHLEKNQGQGYARNFGLKKVNGEFVGFVDPDDWIEPEMYETLYNLAIKYDAELVDSYYAIHRTYNKHTEIEYFTSNVELPKNKIFDKFTNKKYLLSHNLGPCGKLFKRELIKTNNILFANGKFAEDQIFTIKSRFLASKIFFCEKYLYNYRIRNDSSVGKGLPKDAFTLRIDLLKEIKDFLTKQNCFDDFSKYFWDFSTKAIIYNYRRCPYRYKKQMHLKIKKFLPRKYYHKYKEKRRYYANIKERIYSIKDMLFPSGRYQILTILGIKIPLKKYIR